MIFLLSKYLDTQGCLAWVNIMANDWEIEQKPLKAASVGFAIAGEVEVHVPKKEQSWRDRDSLL